MDFGNLFRRTRLDRDYLLMTVLPGTPLSEARGLTRRLWARVLRQVGEYLRALHDLTAPDAWGRHAYGYLGAHRPMEPQTTWADAFAVMWNRLLDDVVACGGYSAAEAGALRDLFEQHRGHFDRPVTPRLLHMDVWGQNVLVDDVGNVTGLVQHGRNPVPVLAFKVESSRFKVKGSGPFNLQLLTFNFQPAAGRTGYILLPSSTS